MFKNGKKQRYANFYEVFENEQKKEKRIDILDQRFEPQILSGNWFELSWKVRVTISNQTQFLKETGLCKQKLSLIRLFSLFF